MSAVESRPDSVRAEEQAASLFEAHSGEILAYCRRHLPSSAEAEDALQTTFLYALRALRRGVEPECEAAWLTAIARNVCSTQRRTLARRGGVVGNVDVDRIALARPEPEEVELLAALPEALAALSDNQRNAIVMREWQGLGAHEIAARLELTPTATSALLTRARRSLATALTTAGRTRSALSASFLLGLVRSQLRALLGSAAAKTAVGAAVATVAVGVVVAERAAHAPAPAPRPTPATPTHAAPVPRAPAPAVPAPRPGARPMARPLRADPAAKEATAAGAGATRQSAAPPTPLSAPSADPAATPSPTSSPPSSTSSPPGAGPVTPVPPVAPPVLPPLPPLPVTAPVVELPVPQVTAPELPVDPPATPPLPPLP